MVNLIEGKILEKKKFLEFNAYKIILKEKSSEVLLDLFSQVHTDFFCL